MPPTRTAPTSRSPCHLTGYWRRRRTDSTTHRTRPATPPWSRRPPPSRRQPGAGFQCDPGDAGRQPRGLPCPSGLPYGSTCPPGPPSLPLSCRPVCRGGLSVSTREIPSVVPQAPGCQPAARSVGLTGIPEHDLIPGGHRRPAGTAAGRLPHRTLTGRVAMPVGRCRRVALSRTALGLRIPGSLAGHGRSEGGWGGSRRGGGSALLGMMRRGTAQT
jgi:hypothetical protein